MKRMLRFFSLLFSGVCLLLLFGGCANRQPEGLAIVDSGGAARVVATDANGEPATDAQGNLLELLTDENGVQQKDNAGNAVTQAVKAPNVYRFGNTIACDLFRYQIPQGWEGTVSPKIQLTLSGTKVTLELQTLHDMTTERFLEFADALFPKQDAEGNKLSEPTVSDCSYAGLSGKKLEMRFATDEGEVQYSAAALVHGEHLIALYFSCPADQNPKPDLATLASHLQVKP